MRAATPGPRSHTTPSRSRPINTGLRLPTRCDSERALTRAGEGRMITAHRKRPVPDPGFGRPQASHRRLGTDEIGEGRFSRKRRKRPQGPAPRSSESTRSKATRGRSASRARSGCRPALPTAEALRPSTLLSYPLGTVSRVMSGDVLVPQVAGPDLLAGLNPSQTEAVTSAAAPLCILAGAGSGKTRALTRRIAWRVARGTADPRHVLALTFTRRAAGELGTRLAHLGVRDQ